MTTSSIIIPTYTTTWFFVEVSLFTKVTNKMLACKGRTYITKYEGWISVNTRTDEKVTLSMIEEEICDFLNTECGVYESDIPTIDQFWTVIEEQSNREFKKPLDEKHLLRKDGKHYWVPLTFH